MDTPTNDNSVPQPATLLRRVQQELFMIVVIYIGYLLLLGPVGALVGHGYLDFVPKRIGQLIGLPALPVFVTPGAHTLFRNYLNWWYPDPYRCECCQN